MTPPRLSARDLRVLYWLVEAIDSKDALTFYSDERRVFHKLAVLAGFSCGCRRCCPGPS